VTILLILITLITETLSIYGQATGLWTSWVWFWLFHGVAAAAYTLACFRLLPEEYKQPTLQSVLFISVISLAMPVAGMIGLTMLYVVLANWPRKPTNILWRRADHIELPSEAQTITTSMFGVAGLKDILLYHPDPERRLAAVKACRYIPNREALPLFRLAVTDKEDDIRLLAFSFIDRMENTLTKKINTLKVKLEKSETASTLVQLGELYWEFYYLGLSDGAITRNYLESAHIYFDKAAALDPRGQIYIKLGRVHLALGNLDEAEMCFENAIAAGSDRDSIALYRAEIAFKRREYGKIDDLLCKCSGGPDGEHSEELQEYWCVSAK